jgi:DNA-binding CsgD family transcriptional regulator
MGTRQGAPIKLGVAEALRSSTQPPFHTLSDVTVNEVRDLLLSEPELARCTTELIVAATGVDLSGLGMFDKQGGAVMLAATHHRSPEWERLVVHPGDGVASRVLNLGGAVTLKNYALESGSSEHLIDVFAHQEGAYGMLAVPINRDGVIIGVLYAGVRRPEYIGDRGRTGLHNLAKLFGATLPLRAQPSDLATDEKHAHSSVHDATLPGCCKTKESGNGSTHLPVLLGGDLSDREKSILRLLSEGIPTKEIASTEFLAVNTVRSYIQSALWKLGANSRLQAVAIAREVGLI